MMNFPCGALPCLAVYTRTHRQMNIRMHFYDMIYHIFSVVSGAMLGFDTVFCSFTNILKPKHEQSIH